MASGSGRVSKVFADTTQALAWLESRQPAVGVDITALTRTLAALRVRFEQSARESRSNASGELAAPPRSRRDHETASSASVDLARKPVITARRIWLASS